MKPNTRNSVTTHNDSPLFINQTLIDKLRQDFVEANWTEAFLEEIYQGEAPLLPTFESLGIQRHWMSRFPDNPAAILTRLFMLGDKITAKQLKLALPHCEIAGALKLGLVKQVNDQGTRFRSLVTISPHQASFDILLTDTSSSQSEATLPETLSANANRENLSDNNLETSTNTDASPNPETALSQLETRSYQLWIASDLPVCLQGENLPNDHVLGVGGASRSLARLTARKVVKRSLDLGTGCGIHAIYLAKHTREQVVATDISARCLNFARFNAALAGRKVASKIDFRLGSFTDPLAEDAGFDLIVSNPPFVITPNRLRESNGLMEYRDGGRAGDGVMAYLLKSLGKFLNPGGICQMLGNWEVTGIDWQNRIRTWLEESGIRLDALVTLREMQNPLAYVQLWLRDEGFDPRVQKRDYQVAVQDWVGDFEARGVEQIAFGYLTFRRVADQRLDFAAESQEVGSQIATPQMAEQVTEPEEAADSSVSSNYIWFTDARGTGSSASGIFITQLLENQELLRTSAGDLWNIPWEVAGDVSEIRFHTPGEEAPNTIKLVQGNAWGLQIEVSALTAGIVGACNGEIPLSVLAEAIAQVTAIPLAQVREQTQAELQILIENAFLV